MRFRRLRNTQLQSQGLIKHTLDMILFFFVNESRESSIENKYRNNSE